MKSMEQVSKSIKHVYKCHSNAYKCTYKVQDRPVGLTTLVIPCGVRSDVSQAKVGSGTGYLSSIVTEITGPSLHHGLDLHEDANMHNRPTI